jgi:hypothetical protein
MRPPMRPFKVRSVAHDWRIRDTLRIRINVNVGEVIGSALSPPTGKIDHALGKQVIPQGMEIKGFDVFDKIRSCGSLRINSFTFSRISASDKNRNSVILLMNDSRNLDDLNVEVHIYRGGNIGNVTL